ncbi:hypothetical protein NQZ68_011341 [Dissostichus eleginoides]|nr:hypothetical protein NQZ68_011341 [Dissostichus eleginoides]
MPAKEVLTGNYQCGIDSELINSPVPSSPKINNTCRWKKGIIDENRSQYDPAQRQILCDITSRLEFIGREPTIPTRRHLSAAVHIAQPAQRVAEYVIPSPEGLPASGPPQPSPIVQRPQPYSIELKASLVFIREQLVLSRVLLAQAHSRPGSLMKTDGLGHSPDAGNTPPSRQIRAKPPIEP